MRVDLNVCLLPSTPHPQTRSLFEQVEFLVKAHRMLGFSVNASLGQPATDCINIIVGIHLVDGETIVSLPPGCIIWNTELLTDEDPLIDLLCELSKIHRLWDSSYGNIARLAVRGVAAQLCTPFLFEQTPQTSMTTPASTAPAADVVVWGPIEGFTATIVEELERRDVRVLKASGNVGPDWERQVSGARLYLDVPAPGERISTARLSALLQKGLPVVAAWGDVTLDAGWREALKVVRVTDAADACVELLAVDGGCQAQAQAAFAQLRRQNSLDIIAALWGLTLEKTSVSFVGDDGRAAQKSIPVDTHYFAICHVDPMFVAPPGTVLVCTGKYQPESSSHLSKSNTGLQEKYRYFTGTAGTFMIAEILQERGAVGAVNAMQYRKFIARQQIGKMSQSYHGMVMVAGDNERRPDVAAAITDVQSEYCFTYPVVLGEIFRQYANVHFAEDFLRFSICAVELDVLTRKELPDFFNYPIMIPGGVEFGRFPVPVYLEIVTKMRAVCELFIQRHEPAAMGHPYQGRGISFCCERLSSWLLIRHLERLKGRPFVSREFIETIGKAGNVPLAEYPSTFSCSEMFGYAHCVEPQLLA